MSDIKQFYELRNDLQKLLGKLTNIIIDLEYNNIIINSDSSDSSDSTIENSDDDEIASNVKYAINTINSDLKLK